jgi:tryptophan synthase alpha chain
MSRISAKFSELRHQHRTGLIPFLTVGYPDLEATLELVPALAESGADIIELGVPFSDPLADGTTIQHASQVALQHGVTLATCLDVVRRLRQQGVEAPLVLMGYYNPVLRYGLEQFCRDTQAAGVDGLIVADLPPEEAAPLRKLARMASLDLIFLLTPTSTEERIKKVSRLASGFIYYVSLTGVTGARDQLPESVPQMLASIRRHTTLPLAVGFGVSRREHVAAIGRHADAVIVGSALLQAIGEAQPGEYVQRAKQFLLGLRDLQAGT